MKILTLFLILSFNLILNSKNKDNFLTNEIYIRLDNIESANFVFNRINEIYEIEKVKSLLVNSNDNLNQIQSDILIESILKLEKTFRIKFKNNQNIPKICYYIKKYFQEVEIIEPIYLPQKSKIEDFNDPYIQSQSVLKQIKAFEAWEIDSGKKEIIIGISDDGMDQNHPDLIRKIYKFEGEIPNNQIDDDNNGYIDDYNGFNFNGADENGKWGDTYSKGNHGTNVAGIIGAEANNDIGIAGVGLKCSIFPLKIAPTDNDSELIYTLESIIYAADRGIDILNCSWGIDKEFSPIEQTAIDYAVEKGLIIIASAGNVGLSLDQSKLVKFYPAAYNGVLGVGNVDQNDFDAGTSSLGMHNRISAQGKNNWSTSNNNKYTNNINGTSFSSPVVAGAAGIVLSKYPNLKPNELIEHLIATADNISDNNNKVRNLISKRLNLLNSVSANPFDKPGIRLIEYSKVDEEGNKLQRVNLNDEFGYKLKFKNFLGKAENLNLKLIVGFESLNNSLEILDSVFSIQIIKQGEEIEINAFKIKSKNFNKRIVVFTLFLDNGLDYFDKITFSDFINSGYQNFENESLIFSLCDDGKFGYENESPNGIGIYDKVLGNQFWRGGIFIQADQTVYNSLNGNFGENLSDLLSTKPFNNDSIQIMRNHSAKTPNIEIIEKVRFVNQESSAKLIFDVVNLSPSDINNLNIGFGFDWDIGRGYDSYLDNQTFQDNNFLKEIFNENVATQISYNEKENIWTGTTLISKANSIIFSSGFNQSDYDLNNIEDDEIIKIFQNSDILQTQDTTDIATFIGLKSLDKIKNNDTLNCELCFAIASNMIRLEEKLRNCILGIESGISFDSNLLKDLEKFRGECLITIYNINGMEIAKKIIVLNNIKDIDLSYLQSGFFILKIENKNDYKFLKIVK